MNTVLVFPGVSEEAAERIEFYRCERLVFESLGDVAVVSNRWTVPRRAFDLAVSWWWARSLPFAARLYRRVPWVITGATDIGNPVRLSRGRLAGKIIVERAAASLATANWAISSAEGARLRSFGFPRLSVVPLAVDTDYYTPPATSAHRDPTLLVTVLQLNDRSVRRKGLLVVLRGLALARDTGMRLVVVGEDQGAQPWLRDCVRAHGIASLVDFAGPVDRQVKRRLFHEAAAYVQLSEYEGFGHAVVEAMSAGCPVIVSRNGSLPEVTAGIAAGYADTPEEFAGVLQQMRPTSNAKQLDAGRQRALTEYSIRVRADRVAGVINDLT